MRGGPSRIGGLLIAIFVAAMVLGHWVRDNRNRGGPSGRPVSSAPGGVQGSDADSQRPTVEQIRQQLVPARNVERRDGTAVAVLVDTSGSMRQKVTDADRGGRPKIDIARERLLDLVSRCEAFAREHPDRPLELGLYEFSARGGVPSSRQILPIGVPNVAAAEAAVRKMQPSGDTPIGEAMIAAKLDLNRTGLSRTHILVLTDGENNRGVAPQRVVEAIAGLAEDSRSSVYFIAFDVAASRFDAVRDAGALVLPASSGGELAQALDYILTGKILAEQPETPPAGAVGGE